MKALLFIGIVCLSLACSAAEIVETAEPSDTKMTFDSSKMPEISWLFMHMNQSGYDTPKDGQVFSFDQYLSSVPDGVPKVNDICYFNDKDKKLCGIVKDIGEDKDVIIIRPIGKGYVIFESVNFSDITGLLRPYKHIGPESEI